MASKNIHEGPYPDAELTALGFEDPEVIGMVQNNLDIIFANEQEIMSLIETKSFNEVITFSKQLGKLVVVTRGKNGAVAINSDKVVECGIKENLKIWINRYKMINDTVDILDAHIVNIGIEFSVLAEDESNKFSVLQACADRLTRDFATNAMNIGESFAVTDVYKSLNNVPGVLDTIDVKMVRKSGTSYSDVPFNINSYMSSDGRTLLIPNTHIFEIKLPTSDIQGVVK